MLHEIAANPLVFQLGWMFGHLSPGVLLGAYPRSLLQRMVLDEKPRICDHAGAENAKGAASSRSREVSNRMAGMGCADMEPLMDACRIGCFGRNR